MRLKSIIVKNLIVAIIPIGMFNSCAVNNEISNPTKFDVYVHSFFASTFLSSFYSSYIDSMSLKGNENILDFGSGWGTTSGLLADKLTKSGSVTCLDISPVWIEASQKRLTSYSNIEFIAGDITQLNISDNSYDIILIHFVLHDIDTSYRQAIIETHQQILKKRGKIYIREPLTPEKTMSVEYVRDIMARNGFLEEKLVNTHSFFMGDMLEGIFVKK